MKRLIVLVAVMFALSACAPKPAPIAAQATGAPAATETQPADTPTPAPTATDTPVPTATNTPKPTLTPTVTPVGGSGRLLIGYGEVQGSSMTGKGIYLLDLKSRRREPVLEGDYLMQALADDGDRLLVSQGASLYLYSLSEGGEPTLLTGNFDPRIRHMETLAYWLDENTVAYASPSTVNLLDVKLLEERPLAEGFYVLPELAPSEDEAGVYWKDASLPALRYSSLDGARQMALNRFAPACITGSGQKIAYNEQVGYKFLASDLSGANEREIFGPESPVYQLQRLWDEGGGVYVCAWSNSGEEILLSINTKRASPWEGEYRHFLLDGNGALVAEIPAELVGKQWLLSAWSPDDRRMVFYYLNHGFTILDVESFEVQNLHLELGISESNAVDRVYWLPAK